jgi:hypothetical protein
MVDAYSLVSYAHDFESTIQDYVTDERQLIGILNFSALWHEVVYLNDIAIGDNPHLILSFLDPGRGSLYLTVVEFIKAGILRCHLRDKIAIRGEAPVQSDGTLTQVFEQWWKDGPPDRFIGQIFGDNRRLYNQAMDKWFKQFPATVVPYDPDTVKPRFRETIRTLVEDSNSSLRQLLKKLPSETEAAYREMCEKNQYFTNADLWRLYKGVPGSEELVVAHGHINQQCCAELVHAGSTGTRVSALDIERFDWTIHVGSEFKPIREPPKTFDEVAERADFVLTAPSLALLGLLTPKQVMQLREVAAKTIFRVAQEAPADLGIETIPKELAALPTLMQQLPIERFRKKYQDALEKYWQHVCEFLEREYPEESTVKGRLAAVAYEKLDQIPAPLRNGLVDISLLFGLNWLAPGETGSMLWKLIAAAKVTPTLGYYLGKLAYRVLLERTPAMEELRQVGLRPAWKPRGVFATNRWT